MTGGRGAGSCPEERAELSSEDKQDLGSEGRAQADAWGQEVPLRHRLAGLKRSLLLAVQWGRKDQKGISLRWRGAVRSGWGI